MAVLPSDCFSYYLPEARIAQRPVHPYDAAKMLVINRSTGALVDSVFGDFASILSPGDLVIFNNSKVIPARLFGSLKGRESSVEILLLKEIGRNRWRALGRPLKKMPSGSEVDISGRLLVTILSRHGEMEIEVEISAVDGKTDPKTLLAEIGTMPVPPYIRSGRGDSQDTVDYQSIFAKYEGSVAAPTASLHFTAKVLSEISERGASVSEVTLHVGAASFLPLWRENQSEQITPPGTERCVYSKELVDKILSVKAAHRRVCAVGTTVVRALESMMRVESGVVEGAEIETSLFISPGFQWNAVDVLVTNFHQPHTTHLLLVEALMGRELLEKAYQHALQNEYRFLSYGDGMVILK